MKAVLKNTILSLLCLASVVLAAPTQSIIISQPAENQQIPAINTINLVQDQTVTACSVKEKALAITDGSIRFACY